MAASSKLSILFSHQKSQKIPRLLSEKWVPVEWSLDLTFDDLSMTLTCVKLFKVVPKDVKLVWKRKFLHLWQIFGNEFDQFQKRLRNWRKSRTKNWRNRPRIWRASSVHSQKKNRVRNIRVHAIHQSTIFLIWTNSKMKLIKSKKRTKLCGKCKLFICKYPKVDFTHSFNYCSTLRPQNALSNCPLFIAPPVK